MPTGTPFTARLSADVDAQATAGTAQSRVVGESPVDGVVTEVTIVPVAAVTANAENYRTFALVNKGTDGEGTTVVASFATKTPETDDLAAFDERALTLSSTAANREVSEGDILAIEETKTGEGVAHGGYTISVKITRA